MINGIGGDFREMRKKHEKAENNDKILIKNGFFDGVSFFGLKHLNKHVNNCGVLILQIFQVLINIA